jgi:acyl-CoA synthetase (AMP-forming)/AMP-acid ligase II
MMSETWRQARTVGDLLRSTAAKRGSHTALAFPGERLSYGQLLEEALTVARGLSALGVRPGDHVGVLMPNCPEFATALFGIGLLGCVFVPLNIRLQRDELRYVVMHSDIAAVLTTDRARDRLRLFEKLRESLPDLREARDATHVRTDSAPRLRLTANLGAGVEPGLLSKSDLKARAREVPSERLKAITDGIDSNGAGAILYTSGTTAKPKGCVLSHRSLFQSWILASERQGVGPDDVVYTPLPLFHGSASGNLVSTIASGATFVSDVHFDATRAVELIAGQRATVLVLIFPHITRSVIEHPRFEAIDAGAVRVILAYVGTRSASEKVQLAFPGAALFSSFGLTESGPVTGSEPEDDLDARLRTCGRPLPGVQVAIADPHTGRLLEREQEGEILVRSPALLLRYYKDSAATAKVLDESGFMHTGDHGLLDIHGRLVFKGRLKDMLKVGGENVAPAEIEELLSTHEAVNEAQVVGIPDDLMGEQIAAFVQLRPGASVTENDLIEYCRKRLARYKIPTHVRFVDEWPMSATKVQKSELRNRLIEELRQRGARG